MIGEEIEKEEMSLLGVSIKKFKYIVKKQNIFQFLIKLIQ